MNLLMIKKSANYAVKTVQLVKILQINASLVEMKRDFWLKILLAKKIVSPMSMLIIKSNVILVTKIAKPAVVQIIISV